MSESTEEITEEERTSRFRAKLLDRLETDNVLSNLRSFTPMKEDVTPRAGDIDKIIKGLADPAMMPLQAKNDAHEMGHPEIPPPFEGVTKFHPLTLKKRWQRRLTERAKARALHDTEPHKRKFNYVPTFEPKGYRSPVGGLVDLLAPDPGQTRSVVFLHHSYYHFYYLAQALRRRGWNAWSLSTESPSNPNQAYYHGEDLSLYHPDPAVQKGILYELVDALRLHFDVLHMHGDGILSIFDENKSANITRNGVPYDLMELRALGVKLGLSMSGCVTAQRATVFNQVTGGVCNTCVWQGNRSVCSETAQYLSGQRIETLINLYALEGDWPADFSRLNRDLCFYEPLTYCVDDKLWTPDLLLPQRIERFERKPGEILVLHSVGGYNEREAGGRNIKGTPAVIDAVKRLNAEGYKVRLIFKTGVPSRDMRYYQIQSDIAVDQLNYGRYGATSRECMALGLPTLTRLHREQPHGLPVSPSLQECPLVDASEATVYDVLKDLLDNPEKRKKIGRKSREYALKWHSSDSCAERFEKAYDRVQNGKSVIDVPSIHAPTPNEGAEPDL